MPEMFGFIIIIWLFTVFRSILVMLFGKKIFKKANKNEKTALYPIINLFTMLEICDINSFWGILFFIPCLNIIILVMMSYKLGTVFNTGFGYKLGLIVFPLLFYFLLSFSDKQYKLSDELYFKAMDRIKEKSINLMTDEEIKKEVENYQEEEKEDVDSIFKSNNQMMEQVEPYKAAQIDLLGLEKLKNHSSEDDPTLKDLGFNSKEEKKEEIVASNTKEEEKKEEIVASNTKKEEKKDDFEVIDL